MKTFTKEQRQQVIDRIEVDVKTRCEELFEFLKQQGYTWATAGVGRSPYWVLRVDTLDKSISIRANVKKAEIAFRYDRPTKEFEKNDNDIKLSEVHEYLIEGKERLVKRFKKIRKAETHRLRRCLKNCHPTPNEFLVQQVRCSQLLKTPLRVLFTFTAASLVFILYHLIVTW